MGEHDNLMNTGAEEGTSPMAEMLKGGYAIQKAENDTLVQMAVQRPRSLQRVLAGAVAELQVNPEYASKQWYSIPYKDKRTGKTSKVEGLSIKAALALGRRFGNMTVVGRMVEETDEAFIVEGVAIDLESNFRMSRQGSVSKVYRDKNTKALRTVPVDRLPMLLGAGTSKQIRNAILAIIPESILIAYWEEARRLAAGGDKKFNRKATIKVCVEAFKEYGVTRKVIEAYVGVSLDKATRQQFLDLKGILNALETKEVKADDVFDLTDDTPPDDAAAGTTLGGDAGTE